MAFLDRAPVFLGHVLVVPRRHVVTLADLAAEELAPYFAVVQRVSATMPAALGCDGTFVAMNNVVSQSVAHLHTQWWPRRRSCFFWPRSVRDDERAEIDRLRAALCSEWHPPSAL